MDYNQLFAFVTHILTVLLLGWYLITNLQWYDYKIKRVILHHHKYHWHIIYFVVPFLAYYLVPQFFWIFFYFAFVPALLIWHRRLDKKLVLTGRVKRFLTLLVFLALFQDFLCFISVACERFGVILPLAVAYIGSTLIERFLFSIYKKDAVKKLKSLSRMRVVIITGSYGKTSMKNFLRQILAHRYNVYASPRSVNTLGGIVRDINESLPSDTDIYVVEAGAREPGDIYAITQLVEPHYAVVGKAGPAHIEYFGSLENIIRTKLEVMTSSRLVRAYVHTSMTKEPHAKVEHFGDETTNIVSTLDGTTFDATIGGRTYHYETSVLGKFQAMNIIGVLRVAHDLGISLDESREYVKQLAQVPHRLEKIEAGGKIILDDGYNGNVDGILDAIAMTESFQGRRIIVTPGLVESTRELNMKIIDRINELFDIAIITGKLNSDLFDQELKVKQKIMLHNKRELEKTLAAFTKEGDLILFANDAPNFI
jgi:UDP-N-acetylmuramoyl-tripeptide--D-alanyl-D-alanine ligase